MGIMEKINSTKEKLNEKMKGSWWLPYKDPDIKEMLKKSEDNELSRAMFIQEITQEESAQGQMIVVRYIDMETGDEEFTRVNKQMASLFAKCSLEITGNPNDLEEEDYKMYEEKKKLFYQPNDFKTYPPNDLCFMIRYCGTMDIGKGRTSHTFTGEKLDITPEEMEAFKKTI